MPPMVVSLIASVITWILTKGVDRIFGKWVAYFTVAWNNAASDKAKEAYNQSITDIQNAIISTDGSVEAWRKRMGIT